MLSSCGPADISKLAQRYPGCDARILNLLNSPGVDFPLGLKVDSDIRSLVVFILHHQLQSWPKDTSFKLIQKMIHWIIQFWSLRDICSRAVDSELGLGHENIAISEVDKKVLVVSLNPILDSDHFE